MEIQVPHKVVDAIREIIDYGIADEQKHYESEPAEGHIYLSMRSVADWLPAMDWVGRAESVVHGADDYEVAIAYLSKLAAKVGLDESYLHQLFEKAVAGNGPNSREAATIMAYAWQAEGNERI